MPNSYTCADQVWNEVRTIEDWLEKESKKKWKSEM